jgi:lysophospholipase L1-like esterase
MHTTTKRSRLVGAALAAVVSLMIVAALASPALSGDVIPPKAFQLSLGDSMGFGLQFDRLFEMLDAGTYTPEAFDTGYTDVLAARMHPLRPDQQTVNLSCPGESTDTMIDGGCSFVLPEPDGPGLSLHTDYAGPQLAAAVSFLQSHPHEVGPVTISIGGIDAGDTIAETCNFDAACVRQSGLRESLGRGLDHILRALQAAAPDTEIVLVAFHNPFAVSNPGTDGLWRRSYTMVQKDAARRNGVLFADVSKIINRGNVCELTFLCASGDPHPTDAGYERIAELIFHVAGYGRSVSR